MSDVDTPAEVGASAGTRSSSTRGKARKRALDVLFEAELRGVEPLTTLADRSADADPPIRDYTAALVRGVVAHQADIDARISASLAQGWSLARMPRVDRSALRIAVFEIDHSPTPNAVAVAEAVRLVGELSTDDSPAFVNGVLRAIASSAVA